MKNTKAWSLALLWFAIASFLAAFILMFSSCSATKRVLKDPVKTEKVAIEYIKANPRKNDTSFLPGTTVIKDTTVYDTVPLPYPVKEKYTERHYTETIVRDTIKIESREFENALVKRIEKLEFDLAELKKDRNAWRTEAWIWRGLVFAIMAFFVLRPVIKAYLKIK